MIHELELKVERQSQTILEKDYEKGILANKVKSLQERLEDVSSQLKEFQRNQDSSVSNSSRLGSKRNSKTSNSSVTSSSKEMVNKTHSAPDPMAGKITITFDEYDSLTIEAARAVQEKNRLERRLEHAGSDKVEMLLGFIAEGIGVGREDLIWEDDEPGKETNFEEKCKESVRKLKVVLGTRATSNKNMAMLRAKQRKTMLFEPASASATADHTSNDDTTPSQKPDLFPTRPSAIPTPSYNSIQRASKRFSTATGGGARRTLGFLAPPPDGGGSKRPSSRTSTLGAGQAASSIGFQLVSGIADSLRGEFNG